MRTVNGADKHDVMARKPSESRNLILHCLVFFLFCVLPFLFCSASYVLAREKIFSFIGAHVWAGMQIPIGMQGALRKLLELDGGVRDGVGDGGYIENVRVSRQVCGAAVCDSFTAVCAALMNAYIPRAGRV